MPHIKKLKTGSYQATVCHDNRTHRRRFKTRTDAQGWHTQKRLELGIGGQQLDAGALADIYAARKLLPPGMSLTQAVSLATQNSRTAQADIPITAAATLYLTDRKSAGLSTEYLYNVRAHLTAVFPKGQTIQTVTAAQLMHWFSAQHLAPITRNNYRLTLSTFFKWSIAAGYRVDNPAAALSKYQVPESIPGILTPAQGAALMQATVAKHPDMVPYLALAAFAGVRPAELMRLDASAIGKEITIAPTISKTRDARYIPIEPNLRKWLANLPQGKICPIREKARNHKLRQARAEADITTWPHDCLRHSYGSYHLALHNDVNATRAAMGHSTTDTLFKHYRQLVSHKQAKAWFNITPN